MTIKRVRLNKNVHEQLLYLKEKSNARSINDVIAKMLELVDDDYINGIIKADKKIISLKYRNGKLVEIQVEKK